MKASTTHRLRAACYVALLASCVFSTSGQLLMKWLVTSTDQVVPTRLFITHLIFVFSVYSIGVLCWMAALLTVRLSVAYPLTSLNYVGILAGSYYFFGEQITPVRIAGVILIFVGVLLVVLRTTEKAIQVRDAKGTQPTGLSGTARRA